MLDSQSWLYKNNIRTMSKLLEKTYNPKSFETKVYERTVKYFEPQDINDYSYTIMMPPPNVTGSLHVGHALTYTIQDILIRYHRQKGNVCVLWQPGMDHAGIATQMVVERELESKGIKVSEMPREEFINAIWKWKENSGGIIVEQQKRLGCSAPWKRSRFTLDSGMSRAVIKAFVTLYKDGLLYRDKRLVNWDTKFKTAISDLEIVNKEEEGSLWYINYKLTSGGDITVATTRPETMFGDTAVAVNPEDNRYKHLVGQKVIIPLTNREIPIIADEYADMSKGSGCVKITPAHDYNDFAVGKKHNLPMINILDENGHMLDIEIIPELIRGVYLKKARKLIVEKLISEGFLIKEEKITHNVPYGDRSGTVIEPMLKDQWFVDAPSLAKKALEAVEDRKTKFIPEKWTNTYYDWMKNIQPWCVSRQIKWGHQIPAWFGKNGEIIVEESEEEAMEVAKRIGISPDDLTRDEDVLDTWFSSSLWPFSTLGWPDSTSWELKKFFPTTVLVTAFDIIFFWVARMMMMSLYFMKEVPFRDVYIHALVRDEKGNKMSKSKGNVLDPIKLMDEYGTDALRFTLAFFSVPGRDIRISREHIKISRNFITKIWNAARFLQGKGIEFNDLRKEIKPKSIVNKWIMTKLYKFRLDIDDNIEKYRFDYAAHNIQFFLRNIYCDFYIEMMKMSEDSETKEVAGFVFSEFLRISHPIIPFVTDQLAEILGITDTFINKSGRDIRIDEKEAEIIVDNFLEKIREIRTKNIVDYEEMISEFPKELKKFNIRPVKNRIE